MEEFFGSGRFCLVKLEKSGDLFMNLKPNDLGPTCFLFNGKSYLLDLCSGAFSFMSKLWLLSEHVTCHLREQLFSEKSLKPLERMVSIGQEGKVYRRRGQRW